MAATSRPSRLRLTPRSVVLLGAALGATVVLLHVLAAATRVLVWIGSAAAIAGLLHPTVRVLVRRGLRQGLAVLGVLVITLAFGSFVAYGAVDGVVRQTRALEKTAPAAARRLEHNQGGVGNAARTFHLASRTKAAIDELPDRLRGGNGVEAARTAVSRGVALLAILVLTVFLLLNAPRVVQAGLDQVVDEQRRARFDRAVRRSYWRSFDYARATVVMAVAAGVVSYGVARLVDVPGPAPLALWIGLWDVVPLVGATIGALPLLGLAAVQSPAKGVIVLVAVVVYQVVESFLVQPRVERATVRVGPFVTVLAGFAGYELYRLLGALLALMAAAVLMAALEELAPA